VKTKTVIASKDIKLRQALEFLFNSEPKANITGSIGDSCGLLAIVRATCPDLILLDWGLPDKPGAELLIDLRRINPKTKTIILSSPETEKEAISAGADICIVKGTSPETILETFRGLYPT
jgi:DNA-binding NarL/FixJ family response regulator